MDTFRLCWLAVALLLCSVSSQKLPSFKQSYSTGMKAGADKHAAAKNEEGGDNNVSEKASPGVEKIKIKIADPPTLSRVPAPHSVPSKTLVLRTQPASIAYPSHLFSLAGECFSTTEKGYKYTVCPFFNVTQKEMGGGWNKFEGVLGVWREWIIENDTIVGMQFVMGEKCGNSDREAMVHFNCSTTTSVHTIKEHHTCKYSMWLDTPLACFKGAMQVYQLLSGDQLRRWDSLDEGCYAGELTEQGLKAKRKEILVEAYLLYSQEQSEHGAFPSKEVLKMFTAPTHATPVPMEKDRGGLINSHIPLTNCIEQTLALRKELKEVKAQFEELRTLIAEFPSVASRYSALKNGSWVPKINLSSDTLHSSLSSHNRTREIKNDIHQVVDREQGPRPDDKASDVRKGDFTAPGSEGHHEGPSSSTHLERETTDNANDPLGQGRDESLKEEETAKGHTPPLREEERAEDSVPLVGKEAHTAGIGSKEQEEEKVQHPHSVTNNGIAVDSRKEFSMGVVHVHGSSEKPYGERSAIKEERRGQQVAGKRVTISTDTPKEPEGDEQVDKALHGKFTPSSDRSRNNGRESL